MVVEKIAAPARGPSCHGSYYVTVHSPTAAKKVVQVFGEDALQQKGWADADNREQRLVLRTKSSASSSSSIRGFAHSHEPRARRRRYSSFVGLADLTRPARGRFSSLILPSLLGGSP